MEKIKTNRCIYDMLKVQDIEIPSIFIYIHITTDYKRT